MKYSIGYQYPDGPESERFPEIVSDYRESVSEVYFAWLDDRSARTPAADASGFTTDEARGILMEDLSELRENGVLLNLLFNANCYAGECISETLKKRVFETLETVQPDSVTTTSPFIAKILRDAGGHWKIRASVNMQIGTLEALEYSGEYFDEYCIARECNYRMELLHSIRRWCGKNDKDFRLLANSGCLKNCPAHIFHDNLVAHIAELVPEQCAKGFDPVFCRHFYAEEANRADYLAWQTMIRPEDVHHYEGLVSTMKLATRTHANPRMVLDAYSAGRFTGNFFDLTEPGHGIFFRGKILDNTRFPDNYWELRTRCPGTDCRTCGVCRRIMKQAFIECNPLQQENCP